MNYGVMSGCRGVGGTGGGGGVGCDGFRGLQNPRGKALGKRKT